MGRIGADAGNGERHERSVPSPRRSRTRTAKEADDRPDVDDERDEAGKFGRYVDLILEVVSLCP